MSVVINFNGAASAAANNLRRSNAMLRNSLNRLSSGSKIVSPADDAGGLAVSMKMEAAIKRYAATNQSIANAKSYLQTQDGALGTAAAMLERINELAVLSEDPTKNASDRESYNTEFKQIRDALKEIEDSTFNGIPLFRQDSLFVKTLGASSQSDIELEGIELREINPPPFELIEDTFSSSANWTNVSEYERTANIDGRMELDGTRSRAQSIIAPPVKGAFEMSFDFKLDSTSSPISVSFDGDSGSELFSYSSNTANNSARIVFDGNETAEVYLNGEPSPSIVNTGLTRRSGNLYIEQAAGGKATFDNLQVTSVPYFSTFSDTFDDPSPWTDTSAGGSASVSSGTLNLDSASGDASSVRTGPLQGDMTIDFDFQMGSTDKELKAFLGGEEVFAFSGDTAANSARIVYRESTNTAAVYLNGSSSASQYSFNLPYELGPLSFQQETGGGTTTVDNLSVTNDAATPFADINRDFSESENWTDQSVLPNAEVSDGELKLDPSIAIARSDFSLSGAFELDFDFKLADTHSPLRVRLGNAPGEELFSFDSDTSNHSAKVVFDGVSAANVYLDGSPTPTATLTGLTSNSGSLSFEHSTGGTTTQIDNVNIVSTEGTPLFTTITESFDSPSTVSTGAVTPNVSVSAGQLRLNSKPSAAELTPTVSGAFHMEFDHQNGSDEAKLDATIGSSSNRVYSYRNDTDLQEVELELSQSSTPSKVRFTHASGAGQTTVDNLLIVARSNYEAVATADDLSILSIDTIKGALEEIATYRAQNGAQQSRLDFTANQISANVENLNSANSRIVDVDIAEESTRLARANILAQAGASMLQQANAASQIALKILAA
ncbi:flagellin [Pelagicoccus sp. SDUM812003]|uniref:flagellin n=1 Tax=Pelagicoccus sp. SDUM812003 TaxID=3041267 RepID=UPI00280DF19F|nr:flagellin [Pelagicoccus sp. SDUM812003]MDQ8204145.1 flagellin [Pelagicoccus sp. SDUM812003]